jgi:kumamolisin
MILKHRGGDLPAPGELFALRSKSQKDIIRNRRRAANEGWSMPFNKYVKLPGSTREPLPGATPTGPIDPNAIMRVTLTLRPRAASPGYPPLDKVIASRQRLSREDFAAHYGANPADVQKVGAFAAANNLAIAQVNLAARSVILTGKAADFAKAFRVQLECYEHSGGTYRGRTGAVSIPSELSKIVQSVTGLDDRPQAQAHFRVAVDDPANPSATSTSYTPLQIAQAYNFPTTFNGAGETIGIVELGGGFTQSDLNIYFSGLNISPVPSVVAVSVDGAQNQPTGDTNGPDTEVMLDIEVAGAVAPAANIVVYFGPNTDAGFLDAINQAVTDNVHKPSVISISWGGPESDWTAQSLQSYNSALQSAAAVGVTVCVACGDNGSTDGVSDGSDHVDFPASSPYSLACGGTSLTIESGKISSEVVWNDLSSGDGATGGGVSATFAVPTWQGSVNVPSSGSFKGRGVPDVAGDADPATGYQVQADGSSFTVGGTSAVAPLWAGLIALFNQSLKQPAGYLNPGLYQNIATQEATFRDITSGNNGDYSAGPGWDACTGWGSPNGASLLQALSSAAPAPTAPPVASAFGLAAASKKTAATAKGKTTAPKRMSAPARRQKPASKARQKTASKRGRRSKG